MTHLLNSDNQIKITFLKQDFSNWAAPQCRQSNSRPNPSEMADQKPLTEIWDFPKWILRLTNSDVDEAQREGLCKSLFQNNGNDCKILW